MFELLRESAKSHKQPWASLYADGHGRYWGLAADYVEKHLAMWTDALLA